MSNVEVDASASAVKTESAETPIKLESDGSSAPGTPDQDLLDLVPPTPPPMEQDEEDEPPLRAKASPDSPNLEQITKHGAREGRTGRSKRLKVEPQIVNEWPVAEKEAMKTFKELPDNIYQSKSIGRSRGKEEGIVCECTYRYGLDDPSVACGHESGCINRLTQVECLEEECQTRGYCQNQRFQKAEYANIEIVLTPNKGYGVRSPDQIEQDTFIYEYVGEVINHPTFLKRMQQYKDEGIRHFYFMMLQREEYLDATKKGGKARFLNHSCNPNCYVEKWQVGKHMRMGIFARRRIYAGEELTFNYNVDRYGNDAQDCFCGEPNCVGSIGGKKQTDLATFDDIFLEALGIEEEVDALDAKGRKGKKAKHLDEDYNPVMRPITLQETSTVVSAIKQATSNRRVLEKLLSRVTMTEDVSVHKAMVRLHGFVLLSGVMDEWRDEADVVLQVLHCLAKFPLLKRNKILSTGIDKQVSDLLADNTDDRIRVIGEELLKGWEKLEMEYVIAKREIKEGERSDDTFLQTQRLLLPLEQQNAPANVSDTIREIVASRYYVPMDKPLPRPRTFERYQSMEQLPKPPAPPQAPTGPSITDIIRQATEKAEREKIAALEAGKKAEEDRKRAEQEARERKKRKALLKSAGGSSSSSSKRHRSEGGHRHSSSSSRPEKKRRSGEESSSSSSMARLEKKLESQVSELVVNTMSKSKDRLDRDVFKKHAKELTKIICEKEKKNTKSWPPAEGKLEAFDKKKREKMKEFASDYIKKLIARKGKDSSSSSKKGEGNPQLPEIPAGLTTPGPSSSITSTPSLHAAGSSLTAINAILSGATATPITPIEADGDGDVAMRTPRSRSSSVVSYASRTDKGSDDSRAGSPAPAEAEEEDVDGDEVVSDAVEQPVAP
ncbi:histone methyltransferase set2 [Tilletia horrida]|uniref:Histone-lysine N-methyltransferase, H3 lysine-36 specific n=1 Tax=Tilletia horrida TaxID=155126 RepID=A0AAN6GTQ2_9BASI|nr:histone methyltransferase set2 [Tilletia horrida]KAK0569030.1 histone methyltransferase set2 [Tilletia horrida]